MDFSDYTFGNFTTESIGENIQQKYRVSKGKSLDSYFGDKTVQIKDKMKLLEDLLKYAEGVYTENETKKRLIFGDNPTEPILNTQDLQRCKDILQKHNGATIRTNSTIIQEKGLKELVDEAQDYCKKDNKVACEKIWDALERLKSYYAMKPSEKKASSERIVNDISNNQPNYHTIFNEEFLFLTKLGNDYRIRHHETTKIDIPDTNYYDYFFNRCLALIDLAIRYLK